MVSVNIKILSFFLLAILLYAFAVMLGLLLRFGFGISEVTVSGERYDIVTYLVLAAIDLIFLFLMILFMAVINIIIWFWNFFMIEGLFKFLGVTISPVSDTVPLTIYNTLDDLRYTFDGFAEVIFGGFSGVIENIFGGWV